MPDSFLFYSLDKLKKVCHAIKQKNVSSERLFFAERMDSNLTMQLLHILVFQASSFNHWHLYFIWGLNNNKKMS
jgi:hypothetical protein